MDQPTIRHPSDVPVEGWDDPIRGSITWRTMISAERTHTSAVTVGIAELQPEAEAGNRLHRHSHPEVYYVIEGEGVVEIDGQPHQLRPGSTVFIPGRVPHSLRNSGASVLRILYTFPADSFDDVVYEFPGADGFDSDSDSDSDSGHQGPASPGVPAAPFARRGRPPSGRAGRTFQTRQRKLSARQLIAAETLLPPIALTPTPKVIDQVAVFGRIAPLILDIGFGLGDTTAAFAKRFPDHNVIGIEVHRPGVVNLSLLLAAQASTNVRVIEADALDVLTWMIAPSTLDVLATYFPDPWPKAGQRSRRLINDSFAELVASRLAPGGSWLVATDTENYAHQALGVALSSGRFHIEGGTFAERDEHRPLTKYERRGIREGRTIFDFTAVRNPSGT